MCLFLLSLSPFQLIGPPVAKKQQFTEEELKEYEKGLMEEEEKSRKLEAKHQKAAENVVSCRVVCGIEIAKMILAGIDV